MDQSTGMGEQEVYGPPGMDGETVGASEFVSTRGGHGLMDVLFPASPPQPKNARIVRLFDLEAAKYDPPAAGTPQENAGATAAPVVATSAPAPKEPRSRNAAREERRSSLAAAAGLF